MKNFFKHPVTITLLILLGVAGLIWGGTALYNAGAENALETELESIEKRLANTSARVNPDEHLKLLARRDWIKKKLENY